MKQIPEYKSVTELVAEYPNLYEYIQELEQRLENCQNLKNKMSLNLSKDSYWHTVVFQEDGCFMEPSWYIKYDAPKDTVELDGTFSIAELELILKYMKRAHK